jgi:hypothetical protein
MFPTVFQRPNSHRRAINFKAKGGVWVESEKGVRIKGKTIRRRGGSKEPEERR